MEALVDTDCVVARLRQALARGELACCPPIADGHGHVWADVALLVRIALADWEQERDEPPARRREPAAAARRRRLAGELWRLYGLTLAPIDGRPAGGPLPGPWLVRRA